MNEQFFENQSRFSFDETVERFSDAVTDSGWKITHTHNLQQTMQNNGFEVLPAKVIELCKPKYAYNILSDDALRVYSNMMPCRVSVYEKADGKTYVSRMNVPMFAAQIGGVVQQTMADAYGEVEKFLKDMMVE